MKPPFVRTAASTALINFCLSRSLNSVLRLYSLADPLLFTRRLFRYSPKFQKPFRPAFSAWGCASRQARLVQPIGEVPVGFRVDVNVPMDALGHESRTKLLTDGGGGARLLDSPSPGNQVAR